LELQHRAGLLSLIFYFVIAERIVRFFEFAAIKKFLHALRFGARVSEGSAGIDVAISAARCVAKRAFLSIA
jgi:hypothetical protein